MARTSDKTIIRVVKALQHVTSSERQREQLVWLQGILEAGHPALQLARRAFNETSPAARRALVNNLGCNATYLTWPIRKEREKRGLGSPSVIVISPTMRCNLRCTGCYAFEYRHDGDLPLEVVDRVVREAKEIGCYFFTISGGEPFIRRDMLDLYEKHDDAVFQVYTNGTLIDDAVAARLGELGNVAPAISVEGFQPETDARRGAGVWDKVMAAMDRLREAGVIFGFSGTVTSRNVDVITSGELVDLMLEKGCYFGWYFMYIPIGREPDLSLMPSPEQRQLCRERVWRWRNEKPIFVADFWNDGHLTGGCMSGGRLYLHITSSGNVEPCVFSHFTVDNIKDKSLQEVLESDFFRAIRRRFPWTDNELTPCMIIDNPWVLREAVAEGHAHPSHPGAETIITDFAEHLDRYSQRMHEITEEGPYANVLPRADQERRSA